MTEVSRSPDLRQGGATANGRRLFTLLETPLSGCRGPASRESSGRGAGAEAEAKPPSFTTLRSGCVATASPSVQTTAEIVTQHATKLGRLHVVCCLLTPDRLSNLYQGTHPKTSRRLLWSLDLDSQSLPIDQVGSYSKKKTNK